MGNTISSTMMSHEAPATDMLAQREVGDEIRYLGIGNSVLTAMIENSMFQDGKRKTSKGLIGKRSVKNVRYEMFTRSYRPYKVTVASGTEVESSGVTLDDDNGLMPYMTLYNPRTDTRCRVESVSSNVIKGVTIGGTTFEAAADDELIVGAPAMPEGSTSSMVVNGSDDQNFNILQFSRWSVSISWVLEAIKQLAGGNRFTREKMYMLWEALADMERTFIMGDYSTDVATKNTSTGEQTGYTGEFPTTRGLLKLAANSVSADGAGNLSWIRKNLPDAMGETTNDNDMYVALCSNELFGRLVDEMDGKYSVDESGELKVFGIKATKLITAGPTIQLVKHNMFNVAGMKNKLLVFNPANIGYVHLEGHDMGPNNGIQTNATHGKQDEVYAYFGIETKDAGKSITLASNMY